MPFDIGSWISENKGLVAVLGAGAAALVLISRNNNQTPTQRTILLQTGDSFSGLNGNPGSEPLPVPAPGVTPGTGPNRPPFPGPGPVRIPPTPSSGPQPPTRRFRMPPAIHEPTDLPPALGGEYPDNGIWGNMIKYAPGYSGGLGGGFNRIINSGTMPATGGGFTPGISGNYNRYSGAVNSGTMPATGGGTTGGYSSLPPDTAKFRYSEAANKNRVF